MRLNLIFSKINFVLTKKRIGILPFAFSLFIFSIFSFASYGHDKKSDINPMTPFTVSFVTSVYNGVNISCPGANDGTIDMTINGGIAPFNILWSNGATTEDISGLAGGIYTVTVVDADLDTTIDFVQLIEPAPVTVIVDSLNNVSCFGLSDGAIYTHAAGGVGGYGFLWSNGSLTDDITGLTAGNYSVTVTDNNGCTGTLDTVVSQPDSIDLGLLTIDANAAADGFASVNPTGGTQPYTYLWSTGETTSSIFNLLPGLYTITVTDAHLCTSTQIATIFNALGPCAIIVDSVKSTSCPGLTDGAAYIDIFSAIAPVTYLWSNGAVTQDITALPAGTYTVTITDVINCNASQTIIVPEADSITDAFSVTAETCNANNGATTVFPGGGSPGYTYLWSTSATGATISNLNTGNYTITITDQNNCTLIDSVFIPERIPPSIVVDSVIDNRCFTSSSGAAYISINNGRTPFSFLWSNSSSSEDVTGLANGTYTVTVTDADLCTATTSVVVSSPPLLNDSVQTTNATCNSSNGAVTVFPYGGISSYTYLWSNSQTTQTISNLPAGSYTVTITDANSCTRLQTVNISNVAIPVAVLDSVRNVKCFGGSTGGVFISVSGGTIPFSYAWSNSAVTQDITNVVSGTYTVTVTDANLCTSVISGTVNQPLAALNDSVQVVNARCGLNNGTITDFPFNGTGPYSYLWSNLQTTQTISNLSPGSYTVTITDANLCTRQRTSVVINIAGPVAVLDSVRNVRCFGNATGGVFISVTGGTIPFSYSWSNSAATQDIVNVVSGIYTVTVTDANLCTSVINGTVSQPAAALNDSVQITNAACGVSNGSVTIYPFNGTSPYTYLWSNTQTAQTIAGLTPGSYTVTVTDANLCTRQRTAVVNNVAGPIAVLDSVRNVKCFGGATGGVFISVSGGSIPYSYNWSNSAVSQDITNIVAGTYTVTVTDANLCTSVISGTVNQPLAALNDSVQVVNATCGLSNGSAKIFPFNGTSPYTFLWSNSQTTQLISGLAPGSYTVTITDAKSCTIQRTASISNIAGAAAILDSVRSVKCFGEVTGGVFISVTGGSIPYSYIWSNGSITQDITNVVAGIYTVTVTDANLCTSIVNGTVNQPLAALNDSVQVVNATCAISNGTVKVFPFNGTSPYSYLWNNSQTSQTITGLTPGSYTVTITDANLCTRQQTATVNNASGPVAILDSVRAVKCFGGATGGVFVSVTGGSIPYSYIWSNGAITQDIINVLAGNYTVTVTDANLCTSVVSGIVTQPLAALNDSVQTTNATCGLNNGLVTIFPYNGTSPYTFLWSNSQTTQTISSLSPASYTVTITDANLCTRQQSATIANVAGPVVVVDSVRNVRCFGGATGGVFISVTGGSIPYSYNWSNSATSQDITNVVAGTYTVTVTDANLCTAVKSGIVNQPTAALNDSVQVTNSSCGSSNGSITVFPYAGTSPYTFLWNNSQTSQTISSLSSGVYTVTITDANLCTTTRIANISNLGGPVIALDSIRNVKCFNGSTGGIFITVSGGAGPYSYLWSNSSVTQDINNVPAGNYTVTVSDLNSCQAIFDTTITQPLQLNDSIQTVNPSCGLSNGSATIFPYGGTSPYTYLWSNTQTTQTINALAAGLYSVTITDANLCSRQRTATLINSSVPVITTDSIVNVKCFGGVTGGVYISVSGGAIPLNYLWSNGALTQDIDNVIAGNYTVTVTDANLCTATKSSVVSQPIIALNDSVHIVNASCGALNGSATVFPYGGTSPYSLLWNNGQTTGTISGLANGNYTVTITDANLCTRQQTASVISSGAPVVVIDSVKNVRCNGNLTGAVYISVTGGQIPYGYLWSNGLITQDIINIAAGNYTVTVSDANNCSATADSAVIQPLILSSTVVATNTSCGLSNGTVTASPSGGIGPYSYLWNNGLTTGVITNLSTGIYTVTVTDFNSCTFVGQDTVQTSSNPVIVIDSVKNVTCNGLGNGAVYTTVSGGTSPLTVLWSNGAVTADIAGLIPGTYSITVTDQNLCTATTSAIITQPSLLNDSTQVTPEACNSANGAVTVFPYGGTAPYTFLWNNNATSQAIAGLTSGNYTVTITDGHGCTKVQVVFIGSSGAPVVVTDSIRNVKCNGGNNGAIFISVSGGSLPYSYLWSNGSLTQDNINLIAGNYSVIVSDQFLCRDTIAFTITQPGPIQDSLNFNPAICGLPNGSAKIYPFGGITPYTYLWSNGQTSQTAINLAPGPYTVTVTDNNQCTHIQNVTITQVPIHVITTDSIFNVTCNGASNGGIYISVSSGEAPYSYLWSNFASTQDISGLNGGSYTVTVTDNNSCTVTKTFNVIESLALSDSVDVFNSTCGQSNGTATIYPIGGTLPYTFLWNTGSTAQTISSLSSGVYTVTVTDSSGCSLIESVPVADIGGPVISLDSLKTVSCNGGANGAIYISVSSGTTPYVYSWSNSVFTPNNIGLTAGTYTITVTDQSNCQQFASYVVSEPNVLADSAQVTNALCGTASGSITAFPYGGTGPYTFQWSSGAASQTALNLFAGTYTLTVTDSKFCTVTSQYTVTNIGGPTLVVDSVKQVKCAGALTGAIYITPSNGTVPYTYLWSNGTVAQDLTSAVAGTYTITLTDFNGCTASISDQINEPAPISAVFNITSANCNSANGAIAATVSGGIPGYGYLWNNSATTPSISSLAAGIYTLTVTDQNNCQKQFNPSVSNISAPTITVVDSGNVTCAGLTNGFITVSVTGGALPYNYSWTNTSQTGNQLTNLPGNTTYTLTITDNLGCISIRSIFISEPLPITITASIPVRNNNFNLTCHGSNDGSIKINASGGTAPLTYQWSNLATTDSIGGLAAGNYTVTVTDANGCSKSTGFVLTQPPLLISNAGSNNVICGVNFDTLDATLPPFGTGYWIVVSGTGTFNNPNLPNAIVSNLADGVNVFQWVVTDGICSAFSQVVISYNTQIEAIAGVNRSVCADSILLTATSPEFGYGYWQTVQSTGVITDSTKASTLVTGLNPGTNVFKWTVINGTCSDTAEVIIFLKDPSDCNETLEMPTGFTPNDDGKNDVFYIKGLGDYPENTLIVYNRWGNKVYEKSGYENDWKGVNENGEPLPDGTYFVVFRVFSIDKILKSYVDIRR